MKIIKENVEDIYPMSNISKGLVYHSIKDVHVNAYHDQVIHQIAVDNFDFSLFEKTMKLLIKKHTNLRSVFNFEKFDEPVHIVLKEVEYEILKEDLTNYSEEDKLKTIRAYLEEDKKKGFKVDSDDLMWRAKVYILDDSNVCLVWSVHHAISDGWSNTVLFNEIITVYKSLSVDKNYTPKPLQISYKDYIILEQKAKKDKNIKSFWQQELKDSKAFIFPGKVNENEQLSYYDRNLSLDYLKKVKRMANAYSIPVKSICFGAYAYASSMLSYDNDFVVGIVNHNRPVCEDGDKLFGCFLNTVPFRVRFKPRSWKEYFEYINDKLNELKSYERYTLSDILNLVGHNPSEGDFINTFYNYIDFSQNVEQYRDKKTTKKNHSDKLDLPWFETSHAILDFMVNTTNEKFTISIKYQQSAINKELVEKFCDYFMNTINALDEFPKIKCNKSQVLNGEERKKIIYEFNATNYDYPKDKTIVDLFSESVSKNPDRIALLCKNNYLTYRELDKQSSSYSITIRKEGVKKSDLVGILQNRSIEMIVSILGVLKSGACYLPLDPLHPEKRNSLIIDKSKIKFLLTDDREIQNKNIQIILTQDIELKEQVLEPEKNISSSSDLCYVIFTSGSTGEPKGVEISHRNVVNFVVSMQDLLSITKNNLCLSLTTVSFDIFGLELFAPLLKGAGVFIGSEEDQVEPSRIYKLMDKHSFEIFQLTPSRLKSLTVEKAGFSHLNKVKNLLVGGEEFPEKLYKEISDSFSGNLFNMYGPTETTIWSTTKQLTKGEELNIGSPIYNTQVYILDSVNQIQAIGIIGELCISGDGLSAGYFDNPELTDEKFIAHPFQKGEKLYRTGDLAKWLPNGNIEFLGRIDYQVKIRGFRIELGEIESVLQSHGYINESVVQAREDNGEKYLCAYIVCGEVFDQKKLREYLSGQLPDYMIPSYFVELDTIPLTSNGKVNHKVLPPPEVKAGDDYVAPSNEAEKKLVNIWSEVLKITEEEIGVQTNFFTIGGNSLNALLAINKITKQMNVKVPLSVFISESNIKQISYYIGKQQKSSREEIQAVEKKEFYPITSAQSRFYVFQKMEPNSTTFNMPGMISLTKEIPFENILKWINKIIEKHEAFRTAFIQKNNNIYQKIYDKVNINIEKYEIKQNDRYSILTKFQRPFDLSKAPILKIGHVIVDGSSEFIIYDTHHIISDVITNEILLRDFNTLSKNEVFTPLKFQYKDYSEWQNSKEQKNNLQNKKEYWLSIFNKDWTTTNVPTDFERPVVLSTEDGSIVGTVFNPSSVERIRNLIQKQNISIFMFFHSIVNILLHKITGQSDFSIGTYTFGRNMPDLEDIVGVFVNHVVVRNSFKVDIGFDYFLKKTSEKIIEAFENQDYPYEDLVDELKVKRQSNHNPIFDIAVNYQEYNNEISVKEEKDCLIHKKGNSGVDLNFQISDYGEKIILEIAYYDKLFLPDTIDRFLKYLNCIVDIVLNDPYIELSEINIIDTPQTRNEGRAKVEFEI